MSHLKDKKEIGVTLLGAIFVKDMLMASLKAKPSP